MSEFSQPDDCSLSGLSTLISETRAAIVEMTRKTELALGAGGSIESALAHGEGACALLGLLQQYRRQYAEQVLASLSDTPEDVLVIRRAEYLALMALADAANSLLAGTDSQESGATRARSAVLARALDRWERARAVDTLDALDVAHGASSE